VCRASSRGAFTGLEEPCVAEIPHNMIRMRLHVDREMANRYSTFACVPWGGLKPYISIG
jgi:hypothetical protein